MAEITPSRILTELDEILTQIGTGPSSVVSRLGFLEADRLTTGQSTMPRSLVNSVVVNQNSQIVRLCYFTSVKTETVTQARVTSGGSAAGATPTLVRFGLYSIAANGDGTLVASTPNDTSLFAASNTLYTKPFSAGTPLSAGERYAFASLVVTAATAPTICGTLLGPVAENGFAPRISGAITGQADLPSTFSSGAVSDSANRVYAAILP